MREWDPGSGGGRLVGRGGRTAALVAGLVALVALLSAFACDEQSELAERLDDARDRWAENAPPDYEMVLFRGCFCGPDGRGPVLLTVVAGEVASRTYVEGGAEVRAELEPFFPDVEGLFDVAEEAVRRADRVEAEFDPELGHPVRLTIDWQENVADEEVDYRIERLTPLAGPSPD